MTEIAKYNGMMSYLTRPPAPKTQVADLVDDLEPGPLKDELLKDFDPTQEEYEEYLQRKGLGERPFNASDGGRANLADGTEEIVEPSKSMQVDTTTKGIPDPLEEFKKQSDLYLQGLMSSYYDKKEAEEYPELPQSKDYFMNLIQQEYDKALEAGVLPEEAISFIKKRSKMYRTLAEEGRMQGEPAILGPSYGRENFEYGGIKLAMEELIQEGNTTFENRQRLLDAIEAKTGTRPGGSFQPSQGDYAELFKKFTFTKPNIRTKQGDPEDYKLNKKQLKSLTKKVEALNKKYKLGEGKGIRIAVESTQTGNASLRIQTNKNVYGDLFTELEISPQKSAVPNDAGLKDLEKIIKKVTNSKVFKNYDKSAAMKAGGVKSAITQLRNAGSKQDLIFDYVLNSEQTPTIEELSKKFKMSKDLIKKDIKKLYVNMYRRAADEGGVF